MSLECQATAQAAQQPGTGPNRVEARLLHLLPKEFLCLSLHPAVSSILRSRKVGELLLRHHALRVEISDAPAFRAGIFVNHGVDQGRLA